ncbi:hypothetical protein PENSTE_c001G06876 [Penicillium steckii]|uniref:Uncharacterized protein n=1 Tax=Penicillium steckii TaxID=303698 RepID=A0A1V6U2N1_9EURO|nr:hypothetical protein PENSTE_c001G06876 [Penicillium steckii]
MAVEHLREKSPYPRSARHVGLIEHLQSQFGQPAYSDIQILAGPQPSRLIHEPHQGVDWEVLYTHMVVLDASPFMLSSEHLSKLFSPFSMALQYLYCVPLITEQSIRDRVSATSHAESAQSLLPEKSMVYFALCYATAGAFLQIPEIVERGMELVHGLLA